ncbi:MAG: response regulator transcription factor [Chloroflexi bacterium]|nr:response regulator transcription factor [Chloroflexota bacterium]
MRERSAAAGPRILVVDDEPNIVELARLYLTAEGYQVETAADGIAALEKVESHAPALVVLDVMMPRLDGWEVCRRLRGRNDRTPVIMLTAKDDDVDRIVGLELGADDYMGKPFNPRELVARVRAVLRRTQEPDRAKRVIAVGNVRLDIGAREVKIGDRVVEMRAKEFDLLVAFAENLGLVLDRETLLRLVWGYDFLGDSRTIDVHVTWLRDKLNGATVRIQTLRGIGYKLVLDARDAPRS